MSSEPRAQANYTAEYIVALGYIIFFCLFSAFCLTFYYLTVSQQRPSPVNAFATSLPPTTPIPHISSPQELSTSTIFEEHFSNNKNNWTGDKNVVKEKVRNGKLFLESKVEENYAFTTCFLCPYLHESYYLQADFATTKATDKNFGLVFNKSSANNAFYLFQINTETKKYFLYHRTPADWSFYAVGESRQIKSFPAVNTLGVYANGDSVELYINGGIVDSYRQSSHSFENGYFGIYADNFGFELTVDNVIVYKVGEQ